MKLENWIVSMGLLVLIIFAFAALNPDDISSLTQEQYSTMGAPTNPLQKQAAAILPMMAMPIAMQPAPAQQAAGAAAPPARNIEQPKLTPGLKDFERARSIRFTGLVQQISEMPEMDGQIHIWIHDLQGKEIEISVAPSWFLTYISCPLVHDIEISGVGFLFNPSKANQLIYARKITIDRKTCQLRNDEGFALWSNRLR